MGHAETTLCLCHMKTWGAWIPVEADMRDKCGSVESTTKNMTYNGMCNAEQKVAQ